MRRSNTPRVRGACASACFAARGVIYGVIGILAVKLAIGPAARTSQRRRPEERLPSQPSGGGSADSWWRSVLRVTRSGGSLAPCSVTGPEDTDSGFERLAALGQRRRVRADLRDRGRDPDRPAESQQLGQPGSIRLRAYSRLARRHVDRRPRGRLALRHCRVPGLSGHHAAVPGRLEDRGDEPGRAEVDHLDRHLRPPRAYGRLRVSSASS